MSIIHNIDASIKSDLNAISIEEYQSPQFNLSGVEDVLPDKTVTRKDIQNAITRGLLNPAYNVPKKNKKFSVENVVHIATIGYLSPTTTIEIASQIGVKVSTWGGQLIAEKTNLFEKYKARDFRYFLYRIAGNKPKGVFINKKLLGDVFSEEKHIPKLIPFLSIDQRIFSGEELIFRVLLEYIGFLKK